MTAVIDFHEPGSKYFPAPDFTPIALGDDAPLSEAIDLVLRAKKKSIQAGEKQQLLRTITNVTGKNDFGSLRQLEEEDWNKLNVPVLCKIYLRHLVLQCQNLTMQQLLECDFNNGLEYDWNQTKDEIQWILNLGFSRNHAIEALMVNNYNQELAVSYLLMEEETRKQKHQQQKKVRNQSVAPNRHWTVVRRLQLEKEKRKNWLKKSENELILEISKLKMQLLSERKKREAIEMKRDEIATRAKQELYKEFLNGIICDQTINTSQFDQWSTYKKKRGITEEEHKQALSDLNQNEKSFDKMKSFGGDDAGDTMEDECIICYDLPKDHMFVPCNHVCICAGCVATYTEDICPMCSEDFTEIKEVLYF